MLSMHSDQYELHFSLYGLTVLSVHIKGLWLAVSREGEGKIIKLG